ncbi:MAG: RICIN domain-containing protein [Prevotella sp.]|nr:RICIN domain-containing protein [Prevotella sp.]
MKTPVIILILAMGAVGSSLHAQVTAKADVTIAFDLSQQGHRFSPTWGIDQAWISQQNARKGINHMGKENIGIGRTCFRTNKALVNDSVLESSEVSKLRERNRWLNLVSDTLPVVLTADQEGGTNEYYVVNKSCKTDHWAANINSHVHWLQQNSRHPVVGVSIFNEPDYWTVEEGATTAKQTQIARMLRERYPRLDNVVIAGGNTLNDDKALEWYNASREYFGWGNTHQLAGSFANFAKFYQTVKNDGKVGYADEMHNVGEAMIALEYGASVGIWWGFDSRARGEFCDISRHGERLAYGEHRTNWTAASVYRHDDGRVKAFIGSSERQAATTSYQFVSLDRDVYYDGQGPLRQFRMEIPGGSVGSYQNGQTNAERVIDVVWGDDVPPTAITAGTYKLVNKGNGNVAAVSGNNIVTTRYTGTKSQQWNVAPCDPRIGGDYSFYDFRVASNGKTCMDVENYSCLTNANVIAYTPSGNPTSNQQWYLQYAGNGYYYVRNRESALYLSANSNRTTNGLSVIQRTLQADSTLHACQLWRLLPTDVAYDTEAPAVPSEPVAESLPAAVSLSWEHGSEDDLDGYMVLRAEVLDDGTTGSWNTIARKVYPPFVDNGILEGHGYRYKVRAIDKSQNMSDASAEVAGMTSGQKAMVAHWTMEGSLEDQTENQHHALAAVTDAEYDDDCQQGAQSIYLRKDQYLQLPTGIVKGNQLTVSMWVKASSSKAWQRLFDFGHDADHYLFLTTYNASSRMRFAIKNGGDEQVLDCPKRMPLLSWHHVVLTIEPGSTAIYLDGEQLAQTDAITISPQDVNPIINYIGRSQFNSDPYLTAYLDDVRIYNYALTSDEVSQLYAQTSGITPAANSDDTGTHTIYTLDGIRLQQPRQGLNIVDGKKTIER